LPQTTDDVLRIVRWCYANDVPLVPRGGGTGLAGGCVPDGGVVIALERLARVRVLDPASWRCELDAGVTTGRLQTLARENGLAFPPDPGASEQSQLGGNIATNAGGPSAFKYGSVGAWVTGLEVVVPPGELMRVGGPFRKDVAGYNLVALLCGSEGTLGVITGAWLRLIPAIETRLPVVAFYETIEAGCAGVHAAMSSGVVPRSIEFFDTACLAIVASGLPVAVPAGAQMMLIAETDGTATEAAASRMLVVEALAEDAFAVTSPDDPTAVSLRRWREGVSGTVSGVRGGKVSEDIVVPVDRLAAAIEGTCRVGERHGLTACSWGHAGDGNLHATMLIDPGNADELERAERAAHELFALASGLNGSLSGEHGLGLTKSAHLANHWDEHSLSLHHAVKRAFDPKGLMNPRKKAPP
jgi:glycolate oxidase subunit GlcD